MSSLVYSVQLNYAFHTGALTGIAGNRPIYLFAYTTPAHVLEWAKQQEIRSGACTLFDYSFDVPDKSGAPGRGLPSSMLDGRFSDVRSSASACDAPALQRVFFVDDGAGGCFIHGWPPCRHVRCIVLPHGIEELRSAAGNGGTLTIIR